MPRTKRILTTPLRSKKDLPRLAKTEAIAKVEQLPVERKTPQKTRVRVSPKSTRSNSPDSINMPPKATPADLSGEGGVRLKTFSGTSDVK